MKQILLLMLIPFCGYSQSLETVFPRDENFNIVFTDVIKVDSLVSAADLYQRAKLFIVDFYKDSKETIQLDDKSSNVIITKGFKKIHITGGLITFVSNLWTNIKIETKDGRYKYTISNIYFSFDYDPATKSKSPDMSAEEYFDPKTFFNSNHEPIPRRLRMYKATKKSIDEDIAQIKKAMSVAAKKDNW